MDHYGEIKRLGEKFPNKNIGCGNPYAKILVVTQKTENKKSDFKKLQKLFRKLPNAKEKETNVLDYCYYIAFDKEVLEDPFFLHFQVIHYIFIDGNQLEQNNPTQLFGMEWIPECTIEDGAFQRLFVAYSRAQENKFQRVLLCTYPFKVLSNTIMKYCMFLLNWFYLSNNYPK